MRRSMTNFFTGLREAWALSKPYFYSEERWAARGLLAAIIVLNLLLVAANLILNFWNRDFFNAIQTMDSASAVQLLFFYKRDPGVLFIMPGFVEIVTVYIVIAVYAFYLNQMLQIKWRQWSTRHYVENWLSDRAYYTISLGSQHAAGVDNPDQRISEDIRDFTTNTLSLGLDFISNLVTLFSFIFVLYAISGSIKLLGVTIPGYMLWVALIYSVIGTVFTHLIGRKLIPLSFAQQKVEADFRYNLVRVRENPEAIALYRGEADEQISLNERFIAVRANFWAIMRRTKALNFFTIGFNQIANIFPIVVALPRYFSHAIQLGGLTQIANAFGQVQGAFSWFVTSYPNLVTYRATISRLHGFQEAVKAARAASAAGPVLGEEGQSLSFKNLTLSLPDGRKLLNNASLTLPPGEPVLLAGPSGAGKSTLFRAIAGIWPFGEGHVTRPSGAALFLPQKPYFPLGSLKRSVVYPAAEADIGDEVVTAALTDSGLAHLIPRLPEIENWGQILSGGEQQRLAISRALIVKPDWLFMDEATSAMDAQLAAQMLTTLRKALPRTTIVAISHDRAAVPGARLLTLNPGALAAD